MEKFKIIIKVSAEKELEKLPNSVIAEILDAIYKLAENPYPNHTKKLKGKNKTTPCFRIRVGNYRILYEVNNGKLIVHVISIGHRKDIYKN